MELVSIRFGIRACECCGEGARTKGEVEHGGSVIEPGTWAHGRREMGAALVL